MGLVAIRCDAVLVWLLCTISFPRCLFECTTGFVRVAQERISEEYVAVKTFEKSRIRDSAARRRLENEIRVCRLVERGDFDWFG